MNAAAQQLPRPRTLTLDVFGIPMEMTRRDQWVLWAWAWVDGRWTKVPIDARTGEKASTTTPATWAPYSVALHYLKQRTGEVHGVGYVFAETDPYCGIDLDKARDPETGTLAPWAQAIIDRFDSYTEWSISGAGAHVIIEGTVPEGGNRKGAVEMYSRARFFVMSGQTIRNGGYIGHRQEELEDFHREQFGSKPKPMGPLSTAPLGVDTEELLARCMGNEKFRRLWDGNDVDYPDDKGGTNTSDADLGFLGVIVRNRGTRDQADALYRRSNRARDKWDRKRGASTYGGITLDKAFNGKIVPFTPTPRLVAHGRPAGLNPQDAALPADDLPDDVASLKAIVIDLRTRVIAAEHRAAAAEARATKLSELQSKTTGILRNTKLGQERFTAVALAYQFGNREAAGDAGDDGLYRIPLARIAEAAGVSEDTASRHVQKLEAEGVARREVKWVPQSVNRETGEIVDAHKALFVGPVTNAVTFVDAVARLDPAKPKNWGGARPRCADHPDADVIKTTVWTCAECGDELQREAETIRPNPQDADLLDDLAATGTDGPRRRAPIPPRGLRPHRYRNDTASHNDAPTQTDVERAYQQLNAIPAVPADRWTDVTIGARP